MVKAGYFADGKGQVAGTEDDEGGGLPGVRAECGIGGEQIGHASGKEGDDDDQGHQRRADDPWPPRARERRVGSTVRH